jgi:hypothetical protein
MADSRACPTCRDAGGVGATIPLAEVRDELALVEDLEREVAARRSRLRAMLPPELFRLVWELGDAEERLGLAERRLAERRVAHLLALHLPSELSAIGAMLDRHLGADPTGGDVN